MRRAILYLLLSSISFAQTAAPAKPKPGSIAGSVVRTDNLQPIKKAKIALEPSYEDSSANLSPEEAVAAYRDRMLETESDETGHFLFSDVPPGKYYLRAEKIGFAAAEAMSTNQSFGLPVTVAAGEALKDVEIKFRPAGAITGRVLNEDGEPMANVTLQAMRYAYSGGKRRLNPEGQAQTNDLGEYRIFNLLPKNYYVRASVSNAEGFSLPTKRQSNKPAQAYWPVFYPDAKTAATATRLEVKPSDEQRANFSLVPGEAFVVSGKVMGIPPSSGREPGYGMAMLISKDWNEPAGTAMLSPKEPSFEIGPVPPGSYQLVAFSAEMTGAGTTNQGMQNFKMGHETVNVAGANVTNVVVNLGNQNTVEVPGKIRVDPAPPAAVDLSRLYVTFESADEESDMENAFANVGAMASRAELKVAARPKRAPSKQSSAGIAAWCNPTLAPLVALRITTPSRSC